jgi:dihydrofolate reductase
VSTPAPVISLIVAMAQNGVIGRDNALPWHLRQDLKRFKAQTLGKPILMGRKTFESIGRPLSGRTNIVLTRDPRWSASGVIAVRTVEEALVRASGSTELVVIGGAEIYRSPTCRPTWPGTPISPSSTRRSGQTWTATRIRLTSTTIIRSPS